MSAAGSSQSAKGAITEGSAAAAYFAAASVGVH